MIRNLKKQKEKIENHLYYLKTVEKLVALQSISEHKEAYQQVINNLVTWHKLTQQ
jgi:hypothetical protein